MDKLDLSNLTPEVAEAWMNENIPTMALGVFLYVCWTQSLSYGKANLVPEWFTPNCDAMAARLEDLYTTEEYVHSGVDLDRRRKDGVVQFKVSLPIKMSIEEIPT